MAAICKILVIEDNPGDVGLVREALNKAAERRFAFELVKGNSLAEGRAILRHDPAVDVVLLDLSLPDSSGITTFTKLHHEFPRIPIIVLSGSTYEGMAITAVREGAQDYIFKEALVDCSLDLTIRYAIERAKLLHNLKNQENRLRTVIDSTADGLAIVSLNRKVLFANRAARTILSLSATSQREARADFQREARADFQREARADLDGEFPYPIRLEGAEEVVTPAAVYEMRAQRTSWDDEEPVYCVTFHDLTEQKRMQESLRDAQARAEGASQLKSEFIANVSHEIRTPMNGVIGMTSLLLETKLTHEQRECVETLRASGEVLLNIINDILDLSKIEAGKLNLEPTDFNLRDVIEETMDLFTRPVREKGLVFTNIVYPGVPPTVHGDSSRLRQILANLISNAIKFTESGGITVAAAVAQEDRETVLVLFEVTDTGSGIAPGEKEFLFQPFTQLPSHTKPRPHGTGLGLSISKRLCEMMGGSIGVRSEPGKGSTFHFTIRFGRWTATKHPRVNLQGRRVLIVSSDSLGTDTLAHQLALRGMECLCVSSAADAMAACRRPGEAPFELVIISAERTESWEGLLAFLNEDAPKRCTPVLLIRGEGHGKPEGVDGVLRTPVRQSQLYSMVARIFRAREAKVIKLRPVDAEPATSSGGSKTGQRAPRSARVLVADDNTVNQKVAARMLKKLGFQCDVVANGREALDAVKRVPYALVLLDCEMPEMDGYEAAARMRQLGDGAKLACRTAPPIVAMTAYTVPEDRQRCLDTGMSGYLAKPMKLEDLKRVVRRWVGEIPAKVRTRPVESAKDGSSSSLDQRVLSELKALGDDTDGDFLRGLIDLYAKEAPATLATLRDALAKQNAKAFREQAHRLKGLSGNLGAQRMVKLCQEAEEKGKARNLAGCEKLIESLERELERTIEALHGEWRAAA